MLWVRCSACGHYVSVSQPIRDEEFLTLQEHLRSHAGSAEFESLDSFAQGEIETLERWFGLEDTRSSGY